SPRRRPYPPHRPRAADHGDFRRGAWRDCAAERSRRRRRARRRAHSRRADQPSPAEDRDRSGQPALSPDRARHRLPAGGRGLTAAEDGRMVTTVETGVSAARALRGAYGRFARKIGDLLPKGLYARSLIIIITPVVLLQAIVAFVFMERHFQTVTAQLSA